MKIDGIVVTEGDLTRYRPGHRVKWFWVKRHLLRRPIHLLVVEDPAPAKNGVYTVTGGSHERPR